MSARNHEIKKTLLLLWLCAMALPAHANPDASPAAPDETWVPQLLGVQYTGILQHLYPFTAPYSGSQSLPVDGDTAISHTVGAYFGMQMPEHLQAYLDIERFTGAGIGGATGLGSPSDGDVVRAGNYLPKTPYVARAFLQYTLPLGDAVTQQDRAMDQLPGDVPVSVFCAKLGKLSVTDDFDQNRYANNTRTQFESWTLIDDGAYDYAADTRGYTDGLVVGYQERTWSLKFGLYRMSQRANQEALEWPITVAHGENLELDLMPDDGGTVLRFLVYRNVARMGVYADAIALAQATGSKPDITADERDGRVKHGFGFNLEQPLADDGETGVFLRAGWNDGQTETFEFTESDRTLSAGMQISGVRWGRADDRLAIAAVVNGLSSVHRRYLELGGCGFELCDGALDYGYESVLEVYYRAQLGRYVQLGPDFQFIENPGYNRARGPARIAGLRLHLSY